MITIVYCSY